MVRIKGSFFDDFILQSLKIEENISKYQYKILYDFQDTNRNQKSTQDKRMLFDSSSTMTVYTVIGSTSSVIGARLGSKCNSEPIT